MVEAKAMKVEAEVIQKLALPHSWYHHSAVLDNFRCSFTFLAVSLLFQLTEFSLKSEVKLKRVCFDFVESLWRMILRHQQRG